MDTSNNSVSGVTGAGLPARLRVWRGKTGTESASADGNPLFGSDRRRFSCDPDEAAQIIGQIGQRNVRASGIYGMRRFVRTLRQDIQAVRNAVLEPWSNGQTEGQINRLKTLKRAMYAPRWR